MSAPTVPSAPDTSRSDAGELLQLIQDLQSRVQRLEDRIGIEAAASVPLLAAEAHAEPVPVTGAAAPSNAAAIVGKVFLAIAGAFVLRALAEYGVIPAALGAGIGIAYALVWLFLAARLPIEAKFATAAACATSVLIMIPLVWDASQKFKVLPSWVSSTVLTGFVLVSLIVSWKKRQVFVSGIAGGSSILLAIVLMFARQDLLPFTLALLVIALAMEVAAWRDHQTGARAAAAIGADCVIFVSSWLLSRPQGLPAEYVPLAHAPLLFLQAFLIAIYLASAAVQTVVRRRTLTFPEMAQTAAALLVGVVGIVWVFQTNTAVMLGLGLAALVAGLACYAVSFLLFESVYMWNFRSWSAFGLFLVLVGTFFPFSGAAFWMLWCACAIASCWAAMVVRRPTLGLHGAVYLLLGSVASKAAGETLARLFGMGNDVFQWLAPLIVLTAAIVSWAAIALSTTGESARWRKQASSLAIAAIITWVTVGIFVQLLVSLWQSSLDGHGIAAPWSTLGTVVLTLMAAALAWASARWQKRELVWIAYGLMVLGAYKLAMRDFENEHSLALVVSLLFYGGVLILLPRLQRHSKPVEPAGS